MDNANDQTNPPWNASTDSNERGTGIFVGPQPDAPNGISKEFVENITYNDCIRRARIGPYDTFKWVPNRIEPFDVLRHTVCYGGPCQVAADCFQNACECRNGQCV